jgi:chemotaxis protein methyltransferase CheR
LKADEIAFVAEVARAAAGLQLGGEQAYVLETRLGPVARREGFGSIREMLIAARDRREEKLLWAVVEALAVGESSFFRDMPTFRRLSEDVLPAVTAAGEPGRPIRILSAGCGSGQETYSIAMAAEDGDVAGLAGRLELIGADLSKRALEKARSGLYTQFEVQRGLPIRALLRHFEKREEMWTAGPRLKALARWRRVNLLGGVGPLGRFDVILCRYVLGGMDSASRERTLAGLIAGLSPGGYLVLGQDEAAAGTAGALERIADGLYRRRGGARAAA